MRRIRVLHLISSFAVEGPLGGVARYVLGLGRAFDVSQIELTIVGLWNYHTGFEEAHCARLNEESIRAVIAADWNEAKPYQSCVQAVNGLRKAQLGTVDIIHSHGEFSDLAALFLARSLGAKATVRTVHNEIEWSKRPLYGKLFPNLFYPFTFTRDLAISRQVETNLNRRILARVLGRQAQVFYNGIDFDRFQDVEKRANIREEFSIALDAPIIGTIGRLTRQKGFDVFLEAIPAVLEKHPTIVVLIIGDGHLRLALEERADSLDISHAVRFAGPRKDIEQLLASMDIFVSASRWEGFPTVLLESIAAEVPIIATTVSGSVELVQHGGNGLLVPPEDAPALSEALDRVLSDLPTYRAGTETARRAAKERFSTTAIAQQLEDLYKTLGTDETG